MTDCSRRVPSDYGLFTKDVLGTVACGVGTLLLISQLNQKKELYMSLYPLKFTPLLFSKIWGGTHIKDWYQPASSSMENVGESWLVSDVDGNPTIVANGPLAGKQLQELISMHGADLVGERVYRAFGERFPLLIKFIDAAEDLSIQVHPDDDTAWDRHRSLGKTEMWYVMPGTAADATIYLGFKEDSDMEELQQALDQHRVVDLFSLYPVKDGDVAFIPAGQVHAIRKGTIVAEIQENSDVTYRLYDYDRVDANGRKRDLHLTDALDVIDYLKPEDELVQHPALTDNQATPVVYSPYFTTAVLPLSEKLERHFGELDSFVIYMCVEGGARVVSECADAPVVEIRRGEALLIPASVKDITLEPIQAENRLLEVYI